MQGLGFHSISIGVFQDRLGKSCFLVRLGRHSGAEAVTIEGNRNIKIMQGQGRPSKNMPSSTTLWFASESARPTSGNGLTPFGWAVLEVLPFDTKEGIYSASKPSTHRKAPVQETRRADSVETLPQMVETPREPARTNWTGATLTWSPGNKTLVASNENKKAELQIGSDRSIVPERFRSKLFEKRKGVRVDIVVETVGNAFKIIDIKDSQ